MSKVLVDFIGKYKKRVDKGIAEELERRLIEVKGVSLHLVPIIEAMQELSIGGKRLRAMLTILGYEIATGKPSGPGPEGQELIKAVAELFHLGLIHGDIMDRIA
jgi:geranylgeranyl diphosphate synthase type I